MTDTRNTAEITRGVLLGTFVGDALAARWEGAPAVSIDLARQRLDQSLDDEVARYTDDTQLTLALAEHLCEHPEVDQTSLVRTFAEHFEGDRGYARGMFGVVAAWERGKSPAEAATSVFPDGSFGNGAAMRAAPVGVVWRSNTAALDDAAARQAEVTHAHPIGKDAAAAQARAVACAADRAAFTADDLREVAAGAATDELRTALMAAHDVAVRQRADPLPYPVVAETIGTGVLADQSVPAALWVAAVADDLPAALLLSLALGGDADTIAAMACAVMGAVETDAAIPTQWLERLEDGERGRSYALALAERLAATADAITAAR